MPDFEEPGSDVFERAIAHYHRECRRNGAGETATYAIGYRIGGRIFVDVASSSGSLAIYELIDGEFADSSADEIDTLLGTEMGLV